MSAEEAEMLFFLTFSDVLEDARQSFLAAGDSPEQARDKMNILCQTWGKFAGLIEDGNAAPSTSPRPPTPPPSQPPSAPPPVIQKKRIREAPAQTPAPNVASFNALAARPPLVIKPVKPQKPKISLAPRPLVFRKL